LENSLNGCFPAVTGLKLLESDDHTEIELNWKL